MAMRDIRVVLEREERQIHDNVMAMAKLAAEALEKATDSLMSQNAELAEAVVGEDAQINALMRIVENECLEALALQQPVARDLRAIIASLQIATDLERIADHGKSIASIVLGMDGSSFDGPLDRIAEMEDTCQNMLTRVMEAYENRDAALARAAAADDNTVDDLDEQAVSSLMMKLMTAPDVGMHATHLLWIAYHLERVGDRVTNIAERVVFMVSAETPDLD
jgi:phosphate transport system protein